MTARLKACPFEGLVAFVRHGEACPFEGMGKFLQLGLLVLLTSVAVAQMAPSHEPVGKAASPHGQMTVTEGGNPHGTGSSTLKAFAAGCGVTDVSESKVRIFVSDRADNWRAVPVSYAGSELDSKVARAWRDEAGKVRVVDVSWSNPAGDVLQMSRMCFSSTGSLRKVTDQYVNVPSCACGRRAEIAYDEQGKQTKRDQDWYRIPSHEKMAPPAGREKFNPTVMQYKTVSALPFANLLKEKNASSH